MQIYCRQCGAPIKAENINLDNLMAKCDECDAVFSFADMYEGVSAKHSRKNTMIEIPMPSGVSINNDGYRLFIQRKWFHWSVLFLLGFAVLWNGVIWTVFIPGFSMTNELPVLFLIPFILVGLYLIFHTVSTLVNQTEITVDRQALDIKHRPIPYPGKQVACTDIEQLYTKHTIHDNDNGTSHTYSLHVVTYDGKHRKLIGNLTQSEQALYIEQEIERFLGIADRPVRGEMR